MKSYWIQLRIPGTQRAYGFTFTAWGLVRYRRGKQVISR